MNVIASWIDVGEIHQPSEFRELWSRCISEISTADLLVVYCEPGETLKGCLVEIGAALAGSIPVFCVGRCTSVVADTVSDASYHHHSLWHWADSVREAAVAYERENMGRVGQFSA